MIECILCLNKILKKNSIKLSSNEDCELSVEELIKLHFWFSETILAHPSPKSIPIICRTCYTKLESFHEFFCAVKSNHKVDESVPVLIDTTTIYVKNEPFEEQLDNVKQDEDAVPDMCSPGNDQSSDSDQPLATIQHKKRKSATNPEETATKKLKFDVEPEFLEVLKVHADFKCEKCSEPLNDWKDIKTHYRQMHKIRGYLRCCGKKIDRSNEVKDHASWHLNPHIFQCHVCGKTAISRENLKIHEETHIPDEDRQYSCPKCDKKFVNKYNLNMHEKIHEKDGKVASIPCNFCDRMYKTERQLKFHVGYCHKSQSNSLICHICSKVLKSKYTLDIHVKAHTNPDDPIECDKCGHILKNKRRFAVHMAKHRSAEAGPYECEKGCGKIFKHRPAMLDHIAFVHTNNRFKCTHCEKEFKHKKTLEDHEVSQHGGIDPYACPFCDRTFKNSGNMHAHKKKTHPDEYKTLSAPNYLRGSIVDYYK
ncbi:transcription factor grauzone-like [Chironomus tepperi]|uniref:transcription factor grauzone-like n=1 Tax=Chironomus tepperi TaxID=113505 RepID=UPI00391EF31C